MRTLLQRFESEYDLIRFSDATDEIAIKNYLIYSVVKGGKPVYDCLVKDQEQVKDKSLLGYIYSNLNNKDIHNNTVSEYIDNLKEYYKLYNDNDNERIVHESSKTHQKPTRNIIPPTVEMVESYCRERNNGIDATEFCDFYQSKGWFIGKDKMKDWQAAIRTWEKKKGFVYTPPKAQSQSGRKRVLQ